MQNPKHDAAIEALRNLLGERLSTGSSIREIHGRDEAYTPPFLPDAVAFPNSTAEVSQIAKVCAQHGCPMVPFGIGTSLEGHVVPIHGGVSIDTSRMNQPRIYQFLIKNALNFYLERGKYIVYAIV